MKTKFVIIISIVLVVALYLIFFATSQGTSSVLLVGELQAQGKDLSRVRVAGRVSADPVDYQVEPKFVLRFQMQDRPAEKNHKGEYDSKEVAPSDVSELPSVPVIYEGVKPDMFTSGRDVIVDGDFRGGTFYASTILTQCPSKYEAPKPGEQNSHPSDISTPEAVS